MGPLRLKPDGTVHQKISRKKWRSSSITLFSRVVMHEIIRHRCPTGRFTAVLLLLLIKLILLSSNSKITGSPPKMCEKFLSREVAAVTKLFGFHQQDLNVKFSWNFAADIQRAGVQINNTFIMRPITTLPTLTYVYLNEKFLTLFLRTGWKSAALPCQR